MMHTLNMDFETYGAVDITKAGSYAYINGEGFLPLLLAWSIDGGEVQQIDFTRGEALSPGWISILNDPDYQKIAWNVTFEREVFRSCFRIDSPIEQWSDTMVWARYAGYPGGLDAASKALGLPEDKAKMAEGKKLIQFFCKPFKGLRRDPSKYPERWELFKTYNRRDVEAEMEIRKIIGSRVSFPKREQTMWEIDQKINDQGILIDEQMCRSAVAMANRQKAKLIEEAVAITKLDNPNSVQQLKDWLGLDDEQTLRKKDVAEMLGTVTDDQQKRVLQIRQELGKSSVKKYEAMLRCACPDGRARGTLQFYGAGRTGRWCLTGDHEVLTPDGWVRIDEWNGGRIACWNPQGSILSFQKSDQVCFDYEGPMYDYEDTRISQISTPDHKMYYKPRYTADFVVGTVEEMAKHRPCIPLTGRRITSPTLGRDNLRVLVMVQADGHYTQDGILRLRFARKRKIERCKHLLRKCEIMFTYTPYTDGTATFSIPLRAQPIWLRMFRKKVFDWWMINEDPDVFFEELPLWDGCWVGPNSQQYSTTKKQNADIVQALAHLSGRTAVIVSKNHNMVNWSPQYVVNIWEKPGAAHEVRAKPVISEFSGKVYCASTPTGFFLVRRNGRVWITGNSGRGLQPQNYPQNHIGDGSMRDLEYARKLVKEGDDDGIELLFGSVNDTLSQLTRTALIPSPGNRFVVADFNAIEARVIAWLADEKWKTQTFIDGKDIYCATASAMFGVPVEKHGINGELRQKGKIAELACIAEGELVLTDRGLVPIQDVTPDDRVWDGEAWVSHEGVIYKGERNVLTYEGLTATLDHLVYIQGQSEPVPFGFAATSGAHLLRSGLNLHPVRVGKDYLSRETMEQELESLPGADPVSGLRSNPVDGSKFSEERKVEGMPELLTATASAKMASEASSGSEGQVREPEQPGVQKLWREEHTVQIPKCLGCWAVPDLEVWDSGQEYGDRPYRHQQGIRGGKSPFRDQEGTDGEPSPYGPESVRSHLLALFGSDCQKEARARGIKRTDYSGCKGCSFLQEKELELHTKKVRVYDIRNAGRYHRFTVSGRLVHNCGYGGGVGALTAMGALDMGLTEEELPGVVDRWRDANSKIVSLWYKVGDACLKVVKGEDNFIRLPHLKTISMPNPEALVISLPSGRDLFYIKPQVGVNRFGGDSLTYMGLNMGKWTRLETFGGKVVENLCQSIARDCLCTIIHRVAKRLNLYPVTHIHDEIVLEAPEAEAEETLQKVLAIMAEPIPWAPGLVLKGAGYCCPWYYKD